VQRDQEEFDRRVFADDDAPHLISDPLRERPVSLVVMILSVVLMSVTALGRLGIPVVGTIPRGLPTFAFPAASLSDFDPLVALALASFLLMYVESMAVARTFAPEPGDAVDPNQEFLALGVANAAVAFGQGYPVTGGMSQSAVNHPSGARTPLALLVAAGLIAAVLAWLTGLFRNLPDALLAAVVLVAAKGMIDLRTLARMRRASPSECWTAMLALVTVLAFGMLRGLLAGVIASVLVLIDRAANPQCEDVFHRKLA
jgi:MFS superfamily sulfate permease-like transporter